MFGLLMAAVFIETLSAPAFNKFLIFSTEVIPPPTVRGIKTSSAVFLTTLKIVFLFSIDAVISKKQISSAPFSE